MIDWTKLSTFNEEIALVWHVGKIHMKLILPCKEQKDKDRVEGCMYELELKNTQYVKGQKMILDKISDNMRDKGKWNDEYEKETLHAYVTKKCWFSLGPSKMDPLYGVGEKNKYIRYYNK